MTPVAPLAELSDESGLAALAQSSFETIIELQASSGAYPASPTFSAYRGYSWFRDGAFIADGVSSFGGVDSANRFFGWCARVLEAREDHIARIVAAAAARTPVPDAEMLATRFTLDGGEGEDDWWDFQLDGYGTWLWAVVAHAERHGVSLEPWQRGIELSVDYLLSSWRRPCFDWWEESAAEVHGSTLGCIAGGLAAVARTQVLDPLRRAAAEDTVAEIRELLIDRGTSNGHLSKWLGSSEVDASLVSVIYPLGVFPATEPLGLATIDAVDAQLAIGNGVHRYLTDTFYGGGQWPLLSCMLGLAYSASGNRERARQLLRWAGTTVTAEGFLPEQVDQHLLAPEYRAEWLERWGTVATPLLWSHAMFIRLAVELGVAQPVKQEAGR